MTPTRPGGVTGETRGKDRETYNGTRACGNWLATTLFDIVNMLGDRSGLRGEKRGYPKLTTVG